MPQGPRCNFCMLYDIDKLAQIMGSPISVRNRSLQDLIEVGGLPDLPANVYTPEQLASGIEVLIDGVPVAWMARLPTACACEGDQPAFYSAVISGHVFEDIAGILRAAMEPEDRKDDEPKRR